MSSKLQRAAKALWREAPIWRYLVIAAGVCTVMALVSGRQGTPPASPTATITQPPSGGSGTQATTGSGASQGTPSSAGQAPPPPGPDPTATARLEAFETEVERLRGEPREGVKCQGMAEALIDLEDGDRPFASPAQAKAVVEAERCQRQLEDSDGRWSELARVAQDAGDTPEAAERLAAAIQGLTTFDRSRALDSDQRGALAAGNDALARLAASDKRVKALADAAAGFDPAGDPGAYLPLVAAARAITPFDRTRMGESERRALRSGDQAAGAIADSDARLREAVDAVTSFERADATATRQDLVRKLAAVTDFDLARADPEQTATIERGRAAGRPVSFDLLIARAQAYGDDPTVEAHEALAALLEVMGPIDEAQLSAPVLEALRAAREAAAALATSDARLKALRADAEAWQSGRAGGAGRRIVAAVEALTDFDRARMTPDDERALRTGEAAYYIVKGPSLGLTAATKPRLAIFLVADEAEVAKSLEQALRRAGYRMTAERGDAALIFEVAGAVTGRGETKLGQSRMLTARTEMTLRSTWALDGDELLRERADGNGIASAGSAAIRKSFERAAERIVARIDAAVGTD